MLEQEITKQNLRTMVIRFYTSVLEDETVGPFFIERLGDDLTSSTWGEHIDLLTNFWASISLGDMAYRSSPMAPHFDMPGLKRETFARWLELFYATLDGLYVESIANQFKERSSIIAGNFMRNLALA